MLKSGKPRHEQISDWIRERIDDGTYAPNAQLPSESQLGEQFKVSRITVRRALQTLESEGLIYRRQGLGAFVSDKRVPQGMVRLTSFVEDMARAGLEASSQIIRFQNEPCPETVAAELDVPPGKMVSRLDRLRLGNGEPVAFDSTWLPVFYGQLLDGYDLSKDTIYRIMEEEHGIPILRGRYRLDAVNADAALAAHLHVVLNKALFLIERLSLTTSDKPVYFQRRYYRTDRVRYELELARDSARWKAGEPAMPLREFAPKFRNAS